MGGTAPRRRAWSRYAKDRLLDLRLCDLGLRIEGTWLEDCLRTVHDEMAERGIRLRPHAWLSSEFFSPGGVPGFAIPFYLAHPRLLRLERGEMLDVEGGSREECLRIMRHECGHAVQHAWRLQLLHQHPLTAHAVQHLKEQRAQQVLGRNRRPTLASDQPEKEEARGGDLRLAEDCRAASQDTPPRQASRRLDVSIRSRRLQPDPNGESGVGILVRGILAGPENAAKSGEHPGLDQRGRPLSLDAEVIMGSRMLRQLRFSAAC